MDLGWDPEIDTPATIAVIGGGLVAVEAALYARFLGYSVMLFDSAKVGHRLLAWGNHRLQSNWATATSSLGLAALEAQGTAETLPADPARLTFRELVEKYLLPLARTDLLYDSVQINAQVVSISRTGCTLDSPISLERRAEQEFRLLIDSKQRGQYSQLADIVLDCSGLRPRRGMASGGGLAIGESALSTDMRSGKVDILGKYRENYAGKHTLLFGNDCCACANALDFASLADDTAGTRLTWVIPKQLGSKGLSFRLPEGLSAEVEQKCRALCESDNLHIISLPAWGIESLRRETDWAARVQVGEEETLDVRCDSVINCAQPAADWSFAEALNLKNSAGNSVITAEPHYYVLGQKAWGDRRCCGFAEGRQQIREVFAQIGGRPDLDLYRLATRSA